MTEYAIDFFRKIYIIVVGEGKKIMREIKVGKIYRHFKGHLYIVEIIAKHSETEELMVVYKNIDTLEYWVRPYDMFNSLVDKEKYQEVTQKYRFEEVRNNDK